ncbi:MAG TPA: GNAT family N-acetyltransferase [Candidatus Acidoferrum sp.]|jgi:GNAT superfamily N-acetyltransferase|nr:GNAT family N-acetyltransferase [Candidatus Acidoferrum sp.]
MAVTIRRAVPADAALLAEHRARVWREAGGHEDDELVPQIPIWTAFFVRAIGEESYVAWIAEEHGHPVGSGALLVHLAIPRPRIVSDREGRVQSVYVEPQARRRGIARAIMAEITAYARSVPLIRLTLHPSEDGRPLYASLGFVPLDEMGMRLMGD